MEVERRDTLDRLNMEGLKQAWGKLWPMGQTRPVKVFTAAQLEETPLNPINALVSHL